MTTGLDLVMGALRKIGQYAAGETLDAVDLQDGLGQLNVLLDALSVEHLAVFNNVENILTIQSGKGIYTVGNPVLGKFLGTVTASSAVITGATNPANLAVGADISGSGIPIGTTVIQLSPLTMSQPASASFVLQQITYTGPGDFKIARPLRITNAYCRLTTSGISQLDYPCTEASNDEYSSIGLKSQPGPWPKLFYYDTGYPLAKLYFWPVPSQASELHLWTDQLFTNVSASDDIQLPQGYALFLQCELALLLAPEYGVQPNPALVAQAMKLKTQLKRLNAAPQPISYYDTAITGRNSNDAGWILHGGFQ